ncbi:ATP-dependent DNA ligase [Nocardia brasiliensis]|uniref:ATP-dependent DNA ligase n=1 Tax=Nocardia brasiliensis TaxID=37326 RepID=UPI001895FDCA|nr:ATP-dependent DNA ligase [Nocardia brasiliensis]MBF6546418.1 ATP-dependent DNA ligase [Nocardia brasiliensis]
MLFSHVVQASETVRATRSRKTKIAAFAELLTTAGPDELAPVVAWVSGELRQGRIGTGWRTLAGLDTPPAPVATLTVSAVDAALSEVAATSGTGSTARRKELLVALWTAATSDEQAFLLRLLTGELRQGALAAIVSEAVAVAAAVPVELVRRAYMLSGRLPVTALAALTGGVAALSEFRLEVGRPIQPMLASPGASLDEALAEFDAKVSAEIKMDGARIQVHRTGPRVWVFTRTLRDITAGVPELVDLVRGLDCDSVVLDGETLALDDSGRPRPFQETMSRFAEVSSTRELLLHPYFFDCLHLDGQDLLDAPLSERRAALTKVAGEHSIPALLEPDAEAAAEYFDGALAAGHEGVMIKSLAAPYAAGRRGRAWQKIKPTHTLDLLVLGAEWGYGRRTGYLSNLHLGARDPHTGEPVMVGKTFKGLTDALLQWQTAEFPRHERTRDEHTVYLYPELVVEIALDGVQVSPRYPGGVALRFARVVRYRPDKEARDADTIDTVRALLP